VFTMTQSTSVRVCKNNQMIETRRKHLWYSEQEVAPHGGPIPRLGVTPGGRKLYHWIPGVGFSISVP